jgi:hypothetical protein
MTWRLLETVVVAVVEEAGIVVVETEAMVATATVMIPFIRDRTTMVHNHTEMTVVVQVTEEGTMEVMEEADMAVVDMGEEVEVGIRINRIHTTRDLLTSPSHPLIPTEAMEGEVAMVAMVEIQLTHEAMPLVIIPMTLVLVVDTTLLHLSKIVIALTEMVAAVAVMAVTVDMAQLHPSPRQVIHREEARLIAAISLVVGVEVGDRR